MKANSEQIAIVGEFLSTANAAVQYAWSGILNYLHIDLKKEWKLYFIKATDKKTKIYTYKHGITSCRDALQRFDPSFPENKKWADFNLQCIGSFKIPGLLTQQEAEKIEAIFHAKFPKNIWMEKYLGHGDFNGLSGITEMVALCDGNVEGDQSPRKDVSLYSYKEAVKFFYTIKSLVENNEPLPILQPRHRCTEKQSLTYEEVAGASFK